MYLLCARVLPWRGLERFLYGAAMLACLVATLPLVEWHGGEMLPLVPTYGL
jgi:hypothetical protein